MSQNKREQMILLWEIYLPASPLAFRSQHARRITRLLSPSSLQRLSEQGACASSPGECLPSVCSPCLALQNRTRSALIFIITHQRLAGILVGCAFHLVRGLREKRAKTKRSRWSYISCPSLESRFVMQNAEFKMRPVDTRKQSEPNWLNKTQVSARRSEC